MSENVNTKSQVVPILLLPLREEQEKQHSKVQTFNFHKSLQNLTVTQDILHHYNLVPTILEDYQVNTVTFL